MAEQIRTAWRSRTAWAIFLIALAAGLAGDLWSKHAAFEAVLRADPQGRPPSVPVVDGALRLTLSTNPGVVFGLRLPPTLVIAASGLAVIVIGVFFATSPACARFTQAALGMVLAGALGNLYDRLFGRVQLPGRPEAVGQVRDFLDLSPLHYPWIFNVADVLLVVGVGILMIAYLHQARIEADAAKADAESRPRTARR